MIEVEPQRGRNSRTTPSLHILIERAWQAPGLERWSFWSYLGYVSSVGLRPLGRRSSKATAAASMALRNSNGS